MNIFGRVKKAWQLSGLYQQAWGDFDGYMAYLMGWDKSGRYIKPDNVSSLIKAYYGTVYSCIDRRSKGVSKIKWKLYTIDTKASRSKAVTNKHKDYLFSLPSLEKSLSSATDMVEIIQDPILDLLKKVNTLQNQSHLKSGTVIHADIYGDSYWHVPKGPLGPASRIFFLFPTNITPIVDMAEGSSTYGDILYYEYDTGKKKIRFEITEIVHFTYFNPHLGVKGFSPTMAACESISLDYAMTDYLFDLISNRLRQEMMLTSEGQLQEGTIKIIQSEMESYRKAKKDKIPILPGNLKPIMLSGNARDLPFIANRKFEREMISNIFNVPIAMLTTESSNRAVQTEIKTEFAEYAIQPLCENIQEQMNQQFIPMFPNSEKKFIAFDDPVPANRELELKERTEYIKSGIRYIDEIREEMNLEPVGIDYPMINGVPIGQQAADQAGKALVDAVRKELGK